MADANGAATTGDALTIHKGITGSTTFINLFRGSRYSSHLRWNPLEAPAEGEKPVPQLTGDNSAVVAYLHIPEDVEKLDPKKTYTFELDCTVQPKKNWALVCATLDLQGLGAVTPNQAIVEPGLMEPTGITVSFRPYKPVDADEVRGCPAAYVFLLT